MFIIVFFFKQKTAYEMRISDWSSDVCSSDLSGMGAITYTDLNGSPLTAGGIGLAVRSDGDIVAGSDGVVTIDTNGVISGDLEGISVVKDRKSVVEGKSVSVRVDLGGRRIIIKKKQIPNNKKHIH